MEIMHTTKPKIIVALLPTFLRNILYAIPFTIVLFGIYYIIDIFANFELQNEVILFGIITFILIISILPLIAKIVIMTSTRYLFYKTHVVSEIRLIKVKRQSMPYHQIINLSVHVNLWNRLWNTGDIILHTAEESAPDLILSYIYNPSEIENSIYRMINSSKPNKKD